MIFVKPASQSQRLFFNGREAGLAMGHKKSCREGGSARSSLSTLPIFIRKRPQPSQIPSFFTSAKRTAFVRLSVSRITRKVVVEFWWFFYEGGMCDWLATRTIRFRWRSGSRCGSRNFFERVHTATAVSWHGLLLSWANLNDCCCRNALVYELVKRRRFDRQRLHTAVRRI